jgi:hypothetical protein
MSNEVNYWYNIGYDESNHGQYPEICVITASNNPEDIVPQDPMIGKKRSNHDTLRLRLREKEYRFLLFDYADRERLYDPKLEIDSGYKKFGVILGSLIYDLPIKDRLNIYIDGDWTQQKIEYAVDLICDLKSLKRAKVKTFFGGKVDRIFNLTNISDELAHSFFPQLTFKTLRDHPNRVNLRLEELLLQT